jgi:hypothetical protein
LRDCADNPPSTLCISLKPSGSASTTVIDNPVQHPCSGGKSRSQPVKWANLLLPALPSFLPVPQRSGAGSCPSCRCQGCSVLITQCESPQAKNCGTEKYWRGGREGVTLFLTHCPGQGYSARSLR